MLDKASTVVLSILTMGGLIAAQEPEQAPRPPEQAPATEKGDPPASPPEAEEPKERDAVPAADEAAPPAQDEAAPEPAAFSFEQAARRLGDERYKERAAAQEDLLAWGSRHLDEGIEALYALYRTSEDPEVRLRARQVLRRLVIVKQPFDGEGYLGIQMDTHQARNERGELQPAVLVTMVREGTAAEVAKVKANDIITGVDQIVFDDLAPTRMFADYIKSKRPGDEITLHVRRGEESLKLTASLRRRSPLLDRLTQWGTQYELPPQEELDEADFQDWLRARTAEERRAARKEPKPAPGP